MNTNKKSFKLLLTGDGNVGKTTFLMSHLGQEFVEPVLQFGEIELQVWVTNYWDLADVDCAIVMMDTTSRVSCENAVSHIKANDMNIPIVAIGNKVDSPDRKVHGNPLQEHCPDIPYFEVSAKTRQNIKTPILYLIGALLDTKAPER